MPTSSFSIPVPTSGFGTAVDVSSLVGEKTVALSGRFRGAYVLYGSHDGSRFAPLLIFNAGGIEGIKQTFKGAFAWLKLKSLATGAAGVSANVSGLSVAGDNSFTSLGVGTVLDLGNDAYQVDLNFMGFGQVNGAVVVEGSLDGIGFNPIGEFASSGAGASLLGGGSGIEFSPVVTSDRVRYVRLNVQGSVGLGFAVTVGGAQSETGGTGGSETLAEAYAVGLTSVDQTMVVLDAKGGKVVFDGTGLSLNPFLSSETVQILGIPGSAQLALGPKNIGIGTTGTPGIVQIESGALFCVAIGQAVVVGSDGVASVAIGNAQVYGGYSVVVGSGSVSRGGSDVCIGNQATDQDGNGNKVIIGTCTGSGAASIAIGTTSHADGQDVAIGQNAEAYSSGTIAIGGGANAEGDGTICIGLLALSGDFSSFDNISIGDGAVTASPGDAWGSSNVAIGSPSFTVITNGSVAIGSGANAQGFDSLTHTDVGLIAIGYGADVISIGASIGIGNGVVVHNTSTFPPSTDEPSIGIGSGASVLGAGGCVLIGTSALTYSNRTVTLGMGSSTYGDGSIAMGYDSLAGDINTAPNAIAIGAASKAYEDSDIAIGSGAYTDDTDSLNDYNIAMGVGAYVLGGSSCISVGVGANVGSRQGIAIGTSAKTDSTDSISIGTQASCTSPEIGGAGQCVAIGYGASAYMANSIGIGYNARTGQLSEQNIVIGSNSVVDDAAVHSNNVLMGIAVNAFCDTSVLIGDTAIIGDVSISSTSGVAVGDSSACFGDYNVAVGSAASVGTNFPIVTPFDYGTAVGSRSSIMGEYGVALGYESGVTGDQGIAIGYSASAGAGEVVFSSSTAGGANKFEVVGSTLGNPDLFKFDVASLFGADTTSLTLLIKKSDGITLASVPVTIGANDSGGAGYAVLRVANT